YTPVIKELQDGIRVNAESIEQIQADIVAQFRRAEVANAERFDLLHEAIATFMKKNNDESSHGKSCQIGFSPIRWKECVKLDFQSRAVFRLSQHTRCRSVGDFVGSFGSRRCSLVSNDSAHSSVQILARVYACAGIGFWSIGV
ncbi:hypothetical protein A2U01_0034497, partial [Trifolium medium]|nr:hypothetical protein [Trifolium medium]